MAHVDTPTTNKLIPWLAARRKIIGIALIVLGAIIAVTPTIITWIWLNNNPPTSEENAPTTATIMTDFAGTVAVNSILALLVIGVGIAFLILRDDAPVLPAQLLMLVLILGGAGGLLIAMVGISLTSHWWELLTDWLARDKREGALKILIALAILLVGLAIMVVSLQVGRTEERTNPAVRRVVYGNNAVLTGLLLLLFLVVANILVGVKFATAIDATSSGQFSISERTTNLIKGLSKPLHIYVVWSSDADATQTMQPLKSLLTAFEERNPHVTVEYLSPLYDRKALFELRKKYPKKFEADEGVFLVWGDGKDEEKNATFIGAASLFERDHRGNLSKFKGEDKIATAITTLEGGEKGKTIVYFTQGLGEPDLESRNPGDDRGLGVLRERLSNRGSFDVRPLKFNPASPKVPDDAGVVVVANPKAPASPAFAQALREYVVDRRGKAVILVDLPQASSALKSLPATGLEGIFDAMNVDVTGNLIYSIPLREMNGRTVLAIGEEERILVQPAESALRTANPLARGFSTETFQFLGARVVKPRETPGNAALNVEALLTTVPGMQVWTETDPSVNTIMVIQQLIRSAAERAKKLASAPLPVAVTVTEGDPLAGMRGQATAAPKPRLVVFGDTTFITNPFIGSDVQFGSENFSLFASTLDWLAERPTSIGLEPRDFSIYPGIPPTARSAYLLFLPGLFAVIGIIGLGLGVWVVRRR